MNAYPVLILALLLCLPIVALCIDCNACRYHCSLTDLSCPGKKAACKTTAASFSTILAPIKAACANQAGRMDEREKIAQAQEILVLTGEFRRSDFEGVSVRWCSALGEWADGMAPDSDLILLHPDHKGDCPGQLAKLLGHEMKHILQRHRWGNEGFGCRYQSELASGHGFGRSNSIEAEAYEFGNRLSQIIGSRCLPNQGSWPHVPTLNERHGACTLTNSRSDACTSAIHRECNARGYGAGVSQEVGSNAFGIGCWQPGWYGDVPLSSLTAHHEGCNALDLSQSPQCMAALHRFCQHFGMNAGISQEVGQNVFGVACWTADWYGVIPFSELTDLHGGCGQHTSQSADCAAAAHRWCSKYRGDGWIGLVQEVSGDAFGIACWGPDYYRVVPVE